jgi:hypothetical protein
MRTIIVSTIYSIVLFSLLFAVLSIILPKHVEPAAEQYISIYNSCQSSYIQHLNSSDIVKVLDQVDRICIKLADTVTKN